MLPYFAELFGTALLILLGDGVVANVVLAKTKGNSSGWIVITTGRGLAVMVSVYAVASRSGAHLNPAITVGLASIGQFPWPKVNRRATGRRRSRCIQLQGAFRLRRAA